MWYDPKSNSQEYGVPLTSDWGETLKSGAAGTYGHPTYLTKPTHLERGFHGRVAAATGKVVTIFAPSNYRGILPLDQQPLVNKPYPYK